MFRLLRFLFIVAILGFLVWCGATVPLGKHTLFGHVSRIWHTDETQDMVNGVKDAAKPAAEKAKRAIKAGVDEAKRNP